MRNRGSVIIGWMMVAVSGIYGGWLLLVFLVAFPPAQYMIPRLLVVLIGLVAGWYVKGKSATGEAGSGP